MLNVSKDGCNSPGRTPVPLPLATVEERPAHFSRLAGEPRLAECTGDASITGKMAFRLSISARGWHCSWVYRPATLALESFNCRVEVGPLESQGQRIVEPA